MTIVYKQVWADGFRSLVDVTIQLDKPGIHGVKGVNVSRQGSNGAGKTSSMEVLAWVIDGSLFSSADDSVNDIVHEELGYCIATAEVSVHGKNYKVRRSRKHPEHGTGVAVFLEEEALKLDKKYDARKSVADVLGIDWSAFAVSNYFSSDTPKLSEGKDAKKRTDIISSLLGLNVDHKKKAQTGLEHVEEKVRGVGIELRSSNSELDRLLALQTAMSNTHTERIVEITEDLVILKVGISAQIGKLKLKEGIQKQYTEVDRDILVLNEKKNLEVNEWQLILSTIRDHIRNNQAECRVRASRQQELTRVSALDTCGECLQKIDASLFEAERKKVAAWIVSASDKVRELKTQDELTVQKITEIEAKYQPVIDEADIRRQSFKAKLDRLDAIPGEITVIKSKMKSLMAEKKRLSKPSEDMSGAIKVCRDEITKLADRTSILQDHIVEMKFWTKGFSRKNLPSDAISLLLPKVSEALDSYTQVISDRQLTAKLVMDKGSPTVQASGSNSGSSYPKLSNGEKRMIDLAMLLACHQATDLRTGGSNILIIDEGADVIDKVGVEAYVRALLFVVENTSVTTIFVISHSEELMSMLPNQLVVTKTDRETRVDWIESDTRTEMIAG